MSSYNWYMAYCLSWQLFCVSLTSSILSNRIWCNWDIIGMTKLTITDNKKKRGNTVDFSKYINRMWARDRRDTKKRWFLSLFEWHYETLIISQWSHIHTHTQVINSRNQLKWKLYRSSDHIDGERRKKRAYKWPIRTNIHYSMIGISYSLVFLLFFVGVLLFSFLVLLLCFCMERRSAFGTDKKAEL